MSDPLFKLPKPVEKAFIIHLKRATERRRQVDLLVQQLGQAAAVFDATDGKSMDQQTRERYQPQKRLTPPYPFALLDNEIACFESHRRVWQKIVDANISAALIVEDDVALDGVVFQKALNTAADSLADHGFVRLPKQLRGATNEDVARLRRRPIGLGMQAQLVSRQAAQQLLNFTAHFDRPVDTMLQMTWAHKVDIVEIWPSGVSEIDQQLGGTTVQRKQKSLFQIATRSVNRALYRAKVRRYSRN